MTREWFYIAFLGFISGPRRWAAQTVQTQSTIGIEIDFYYFCAENCVTVSSGVGMIKSLLEGSTRMVIRFEKLFCSYFSQIRRSFRNCPGS